MKASTLPAAASLALLAALLLPAGIAAGDSSQSTASPAADGVILFGDAHSAIPCRLLVETDADTVVDRGSIEDLGDWHAFVGTFRYWKEPTGRMLYIYDDVSNLVGRIVNPKSVVVLSMVN